LAAIKWSNFAKKLDNKVQKPTKVSSFKLLKIGKNKVKNDGSQEIKNSDLVVLFP